VIRFVTLLAGGSGTPRDDLVERIDAEARSIASRLGARGSVRRAFVILEEPALAGGDFSIGISDFDAVLEALLPAEDDLDRALECFSGLATRLSDSVDPSRSAAIVGTDHLIVEGMGAMQVHVALRRLSSLTHEAFSAFWRDEFAPVVRTTPNLVGYRQVHAHAGVSTDAANATGLADQGFDGVAVEWFPSIPLLQDAAVWSDELEAHLATRRRFLDLPRSRSLLSDNPSE
jgi:hypothetical protein